jgi:hypothetical protein
MPHITFIHGLANKPAADSLHRIWLRALEDGGNGLHLGNEGVDSSMLYWAGVLYEKPDENEADYESTLESTAEQVDAGGEGELPPVGSRTEAEARFIEAMFYRFTNASEAQWEAEQAANSSGAAAVGLERIPLPWFLKKRIMKALLRDAHAFYFNIEHSPRAGTTWKVRDEIRRRTIAELSIPRSRPHIIVAHSMGTMIAYDALKRIGDCPAIDGLVTIGSPLGIDEVQDCNKPEWSRDNGYPFEKIGSGRWINVYDILDVVCGGDPRFANDFKQEGKIRIEDISVTNDGAWRHSIVKYLRQKELQNVLRSLLGRED